MLEDEQVRVVGAGYRLLTRPYWRPNVLLIEIPMLLMRGVRSEHAHSVQNGSNTMIDIPGEIATLTYQSLSVQG